MNNVQEEIDRIEDQISKANAEIAIAVRKRREVGKDSPMVADYNTAVSTARQALSAIEIKLRALYESKEE